MRHALPELLHLVGWRKLTLLAALTLVAAATEGIGFILLVPLLTALDPSMASAAAQSPIGEFFGEFAFRPSLSAMLALFVLLVAIRALAEFWRSLAALDVGFRLVDGLRGKAIAALVEADWRALSRMHQSDNRALLISTINQVSITADTFFSVLRSLFVLGAIGFAALLISPAVAIVGMLGGIVVLALYGGLRRRARQLGELIGERNRGIHSRLEESLDALRLIKSFGNEEWARREAAAGFGGLREVQRRYLTDTGRARVLLQIGAGSLVAMLAWLALERWDYPPAVLLPLIALFARGVPQLAQLQENWQRWAHNSPALVAAQRLIAEAESKAEPPLAPDTPVPQLRTSLRLENVALHHRANAPAVTAIDLEIPARSALALVGPSGAGKSTLADIVGGLIAPDEGRVLVDGVELGPQKRRAWRSRVAYVHQEPVLFSGTIRQNLLWASPDADDARMGEVLEAAAASFVHDLPGGLDCDLGEGGRHLSGGERQRIVLARALLREPDLLILDEATSALDPDSDRAVAGAVAGLKGQRTILIIGHRGLLTEVADRTVRIESGRLVSYDPR